MSTRGICVSSPVCWSGRYMKVFLMRGWEIIFPGCGETSVLARRATLAARWLHEPQPISHHPVGLGFPHPAGRYRPRGYAFSSPGCSSCRDVEDFLIRTREPILPGMRSLYVRSPANQRSASGTGVSTPCGTVSTRGICVFVPRLSELRSY